MLLKAQESGGKGRGAQSSQDGWSGGVGQVLPEFPPDRPYKKAEKSRDLVEV